MISISRYLQRDVLGLLIENKLDYVIVPACTLLDSKFILVKLVATLNWSRDPLL